MTDQPDREERVRRLLAASAAGPPPRVPDDVATSLDAELVRLTQERADRGAGDQDAAGPPAAGATTGPRRRRWPALLAAAALVSVVAVGVGTVVDQRSGDGDGVLSTDAGGSAQGQAEGGAGQAPDDRGAQSLEGTVREQQSVPALHRDTLRADVQRVLDRGLAVPAAPPGALRAACVRPDVGPGDAWVAVRLDGASAVLVLHPGDGGRRTADVFTCADGTSPAATVTVTER